MISEAQARMIVGAYRMGVDPEVASPIIGVEEVQFSAIAQHWAHLGDNWDPEASALRAELLISDLMEDWKEIHETMNLTDEQLQEIWNT